MRKRIKELIKSFKEIQPELEAKWNSNYIEIYNTGGIISILSIQDFSKRIESELKSNTQSNITSYTNTISFGDLTSQIDEKYIVIDEDIDVTKIELYKMLIMNRVALPFIYFSKSDDKLTHIGGLSIKTLLFCMNEILSDADISPLSSYRLRNTRFDYVVISNCDNLDLFRNM